ncbi:MAG: hypothetical protein NVSMB65_05210 [Chloroflexota bacterium]
MVDTSPEVRLQLVAAATSHVDAVLFTHSHADHLHGIDDLRRFNEMLPGGVPVYAAPEVLRDIRVRFPYIFASGGQVGGGIPTLSLRPIDGPFEACGVAVVPVPVLHGQLPILGFRFGAFAYVTDCSHIPPSSMDLLRGLDVLVLDALRPEPHPTHFSLAQAIAMAQALRPKRTFFTHLTHAIAHRDVSATLPDGIHLGYDGLRIYVEGGSDAGRH